MGRREDVENVAGLAELRAWLDEHESRWGRGRDAADDRRAIELREALRALLMANGGLEPDPRPRRWSTRRRGAPARRAVDPDGRRPYRTQATAWTAPWAESSRSPTRAGMAGGSWRRLKACLADDCRGVLDRSRNRSPARCEMKICGNRPEVRSYRERHHRPHALRD